MLGIIKAKYKNKAVSILKFFTEAQEKQEIQLKNKKIIQCKRGQINANKTSVEKAALKSEKQTEILKINRNSEADKCGKDLLNSKWYNAVTDREIHVMGAL